MRSALLTGLLLVLLVFAEPASARNVVDHRNESTGGSAFALNANSVFELTLRRTAGQTTTCQTRNTTGDGDPVLHVLQMPTGSGAVSELARDDDSGGNLNARVTFRAPSAGRYLLILRASNAFSAGATDLSCDGRPVVLGVKLGGAFKRLVNLRSSESLRTVALPGGPRLHALYILDDAGKMLSRNESDVSESTYITGGIQGTRVAMVAGRWPDPAGGIRLIRNDNAISGHDPDGDSLGTELEAHIGTCSWRSDVAGGWACSGAADMRDTDGDAIRDDEELIGRLGSEPYQWLARWGADPRHKDIFIEIDFGQQSVGEAPRISCKVAPDNVMFTPYFCPQSARRMAEIYADTADLYPDVDANQRSRLMHARTLNNPDLKPGISLHFDTGLAPPAGAPPADAAIYGDWGGHNYVAPVCDADGKCARASAHDVRSSQMHANRRGLFHYALGDPGCGGQANGPRMSLHLPLCDENGASHEFGHSLGLAHYGPAQTGIVNTSGDDAGEDLNCKPNYPSLMNYAYAGADRDRFFPTFSDGRGRPTIDNSALKERGAVPQPTSPAGRRYLMLLVDVFGYNVNLISGDVDWNRDGVFSATSVRAYANNHGNSAGGCEGTRPTRMRAAGLTMVSPALSRIGAQTVIVYTDKRDQKLYIETTDSALTCPSFGDTCGTLQRRDIAHAWNNDVLAVDAHPISIDGEARLLVVYRTSTGLYETIMSGQYVWTQPRRITTSSTPVDEFSLAGAGDIVWLAFKNAQRRVVMKTRGADGVWRSDEVAADATGAMLPQIGPAAAPGLLKVTYKDGREALIGAFPTTPQGFLRLYERSLSDASWQPLPWRIVEEKPVLGRPAMAFVPVAAESPLPGRLHVLIVQRCTQPNCPDNNVAADGFLAANGVGQGAAMEILISEHDNTWLYAAGVDLLYEHGVDANVRAAIAFAAGGDLQHSLWLRPKADGIVAHPQRDWDDWLAIGVGTCLSLVDGGAQVRCPQWPFGGRPTSRPPDVQCVANCRDDYRSCLDGEVASRRQCQRAQTMCLARCGQ